jgi:hypothetical protein
MVGAGVAAALSDCTHARALGSRGTLPTSAETFSRQLLTFSFDSDDAAGGAPSKKASNANTGPGCILKQESSFDGDGW